jgi:hypothetical protein
MGNENEVSHFWLELLFSLQQGALGQVHSISAPAFKVFHQPSVDVVRKLARGS